MSLDFAEQSKFICINRHKKRQLLVLRDKKILKNFLCLIFLASSEKF